MFYIIETNTELEYAATNRKMSVNNQTLSTNLINMAFTFKEYAERLNKSVAACEKLIDHRIRLAVSGHKFNGIVTIYGSDITEAMLGILSPRYLKAGWVRISKPSADQIALYYNKNDLTITPSKEVKKRTDAVIATKARPIKVGLTREVDDGILNYGDAVPF